MPSVKKAAKAKAKLRQGAGGRLAKAVPPKLDNAGRPIFSFQFADRNYSGSWSWCSGDDVRELLDFLCEMSQLTWSEIHNQQTGGRSRHKKHHSQGLGTVCPEAQARLTALGLDEVFEDYFRFRLGGTKRLWGTRIGDVFYVLWWDAHHQVYPTEQS